MSQGPGLVHPCTTPIRGPQWIWLRIWILGLNLDLSCALDLSMCNMIEFLQAHCVILDTSICVFIS